MSQRTSTPILQHSNSCVERVADRLWPLLKPNWIDLMPNPIHIIAEAGTNHNADLATAKKLVDVASESGCDSIKFQIIYPEGLYLPRLFVDGAYEENAVFEIRRKAMLPDDDWRTVAAHCREKGIPISASVFDERGLDLLMEFDPPYIKIASCDLNNSAFIRQAAERGRKLIVSTGMASLAEVEQMLKDVAETGNNDIVLMHCVSVYPCPVEATNLKFIEELRTTFDVAVGFSDHTESSVAAAIAVSMGVTWIEKHFTLDRGGEGFDHAYAMEPTALSQYVFDIRASRQACTPPAEKVGETEASVRTRARRGLHAARDIKAGEVINPEDVLVTRPEGPLKPNEIRLVLGKTARRPIHQYEPLSLDFFR